MGCVKSKKRQSSEKSGGGARGGEKAFLVSSETTGLENGSPQVDPMLLDYAQKLSEEILSRAVQQWVEVDRRYGDIPYIECDAP